MDVVPRNISMEKARELEICGKTLKKPTGMFFQVSWRKDFDMK